MKKPEVGDMLWFEARPRYGASGPVTVTKVGRKWASYGPSYRRDRFDITNGEVDGYGYEPHGRVWPTQTDALVDARRCKLWQAVELGMGYHAPEGVTIDDIEAAAKLLKIPVSL